jgi:hypothetical protein
MHTKFWFESLKGEDHSEDLGIYRKIVKVWIGFIWLRDQ